MLANGPCGNLFHTLYKVARTVNSSLDIMEVLQTIVTSTTEALSARACSLRLLGPDGKHLMFGAAYGLSASYRAKGRVLIEQSNIDRLALAGDSAVFVSDARSDPRFQYPEQAREEGIVSVLVVPLRVQDQPIGVMRVYTGRTAHLLRGRAGVGGSDRQPERAGHRKRPPLRTAGPQLPGRGRLWRAVV